MTETTVAERYVVNINKLECIVMREFGIGPHAFKHLLHNRHAARARWTLWHFLSRKMGWSELAVSRLYDRDPSTIHSACAKAGVLLKLGRYPEMARATARMTAVVELHPGCWIDWGMGPRLGGPVRGEPR